MKTEKQKVIGIDARFFGEAGPGRYAKNIISHLEKIDGVNKYIVFLRPRGFDSYNPENPNFEKVLADYNWYSFDEQIRFLFKIYKYKLDLLYVPHFNVPIFYTGRLVTAIPDLIMHEFSTEKGTTLFKPYFRFKKVIYKLVFERAVTKSEKIIIPAQTVLEDFLKFYPYISKDKYLVAQEGIDPDIKDADTSRSYEVLNKFDIKKPFLLYISSMYEHKNVPRLIQAFEILVNKYSFGGQLVLVGKKDKFSEEISKLVSSMSLGEKVLLPGMRDYISDEETCGMRKECEAYVFPSLTEGFSLTPMEAQYFGKACAVSDIPIHREVYGDSVLYFDPQNIEDIAEKINLLLTNLDLRQDLINKGYKNVLKYSWDKTAEVTLGVFNDVLKNR
jgi:glycosyltransferase involved in cell wall biosynthesis